MVSRACRENTLICILCKDRLEYLVYTWASLKKTVKDIPIYIYDDGSTNQFLLEYLTTNRLISLVNPININCETLTKYVGQFPILNSIQGIGDQIKLVHKSYSLGNTLISYQMVREIFDRHSSIDYIIRLEDDVVFKEGWFDDLLDQWNNWNVINRGLLCSCAVQNYYRTGTREITTHINPSFQCVLIPRYFYELDKEFWYRIEKFETKTDLYFRQHCLDLQLKCGLLPSSICQHIGVRSLEVPKQDSYFSSTYSFDQRLDYSVDPPFVF